VTRTPGQEENRLTCSERGVQGGRGVKTSSILLLAALLATTRSRVTAQGRHAPVGSDHSGFGRSICFCGDIDGDQCSEIAVGSRSEGVQRQGAVLIYSGKTGELLRPIAGEVPGAGFGTELCNAGDQDGDGIPDLAVATPLARHSQGSGTIDIRSGRDGKRIQQLNGTDEENYFGTNLVAIGDLDGDKKPELLVRMRIGGGPKEQERFVVVSPGSGKQMFTIDAPVGFVCRENGLPVCALGDVDGDKVPDFAVEYGAQVFVRSGKDGKEIVTLGVPLVSGTSSTFGISMCALGDVDGDGLADIAVGDPTLRDEGTVRFFSSKDGKEICKGPNLKLGVGFALDRIGDINRDGFSDLIASWCKKQGGEAFVISGKDASKLVWSDPRIPGDPADNPDPQPTPSTNYSAPLGWRVAGGFDVDGDKAPDFMVSCYWPTSSSGAAVLVFSGNGGSRIREILPPPDSATGTPR